jgi:hypothetical protein
VFVFHFCGFLIWIGAFSWQLPSFSDIQTEATVRLWLGVWLMLLRLVFGSLLGLVHELELILALVLKFVLAPKLVLITRRLFELRSAPGH